MTTPCELCEGTGRQKDENTVNPTHVECPDCHGNGFTGEREIEPIVEEEESTEEEVPVEPVKKKKTK